MKVITVAVQLLVAATHAKKKIFESPVSLETKGGSNIDIPSAYLSLAGMEDNYYEHGHSIVGTKDIQNYFNLQITTKLYIGSNSEPHDLILDTGSMVSKETLIEK